MNYNSACCRKGRKTAGGVIEVKGKIVMDTSAEPLIPVQPDFPPTRSRMLPPRPPRQQHLFRRRRRAIREICNTKPSDGSVINPAAAMRVMPDAAGDPCKTKPIPEVVPPETSAPEARKGIAQDFCKTKPISAIESSASVPGENVSDNFLQNKPNGSL